MIEEMYDVRVTVQQNAILLNQTDQDSGQIVLHPDQVDILIKWLEKAKKTCEKDI